MKHFVALLSIVIFTSHVSAQQKSSTPKTINGLGLFTLGQPLLESDTLLKCAENKESRISLYGGTIAPCKAFYFLPAETDSITIGKVGFKVVVLFPDDHQKLEGVSFMKSYVTTGSDNTRQSAELDMKFMKAAIDSYFSMTGEKYKPKGGKNQYSSESGFTWKKDNLKYTLLRTKLKMRSDKQVVTDLLNFGFYKSK